MLLKERKQPKIKAKKLCLNEEGKLYSPEWGGHTHIPSGFFKMHEWSRLDCCILTKQKPFVCKLNLYSISQHTKHALFYFSWNMKRYKNIFSFATTNTEVGITFSVFSPFYNKKNNLSKWKNSVLGTLREGVGQQQPAMHDLPKRAGSYPPGNTDPPGNTELYVARWNHIFKKHRKSCFYIKYSVFKGKQLI